MLTNILINYLVFVRSMTKILTCSRMLKEKNVSSTTNKVNTVIKMDAINLLNPNTNA